jgi:hypothetical protein
LEPEYQELFERIVDLTRRSKTDELRVMLDARASALGLEPIRSVDPKHSASAPIGVMPVLSPIASGALPRRVTTN